MSTKQQFSREKLQIFFLFWYNHIAFNYSFPGHCRSGTERTSTDCEMAGINYHATQRAADLDSTIMFGDNFTRELLEDSTISLGERVAIEMQDHWQEGYEPLLHDLLEAIAAVHVRRVLTLMRQAVALYELLNIAGPLVGLASLALDRLVNIPDLFECGPSSVNTHSDQRDRADTTQENCSICLDEYEEREEVCKLNCGHKYHSQCIDKWLSMGNMVCPYCRAHIE